MADLLERLKAALADRYRIDRELGSGGMATVYLAQDLRHERQVAVKVLRPELAAALGPERFHQEIKIAANLTHPHILPLHDSGDADGFLYYVMPHIEGESLRDKLAKEGELPIAQAVRILRDVLDALSEAHEKGVVHRDIKPDNILLTKHHALVTDFGVAKAVSEATGVHRLTTEGVALGTPAYMSPEQAAADKHIDHRADIYAVGVLAYELLTGRPPFTGTTPQEVLSAQVTQAPEPVTKYRAAVPPALAQVVMKCLEKKAADRWQSAEELLPQLEALATPSGGVTPTETKPVAALGRPHRGLIAAAAAIVVTIIAAVALLRPSTALSPLSFAQTRQVTLEPELELDPALSPDGSRLAYVSEQRSLSTIFVRDVSGGAAVAVTDGFAGLHRVPRWSPDGTLILFSSDRGVYVVPPLGGSARLVVPAGDDGVRFATWSPNGEEIAYVKGPAAAVTELHAQPLEGGEGRKIAEGFDIHSPSWSPDGRLIAYVSGNVQYNYGGAILGNLGPSTIHVVPAMGGEVIDLTGRQFLHMSPIWSPDSRSLLLVSSRGGGRDVYRMPIDGSGRPAGEMERLTTGLSAGTITLAADGSRLAYSVFTNTANVWSVRISQTGLVSVREAEPVTRGTQHIEGLDVTPDGEWLTFDSDRGGNVDIYKMRLDGGAPQRLTTHPSDDFIPAWSPDGRWIVFHSWRNENRDVYVISADGGTPEQVTSDPAHDMYAEWSPDGRHLVFYSIRTGNYELYVSERTSPGRWKMPQRLTTQGGTASDWAPDGESIAYMGPEGLHLYSFADSGSRVLLRHFERGGVSYSIRSVRYAPDGRTLYVKVSDENGRPSFWELSATGGSPRQIVVFDDPTRPSSRQEFAADGKRLYFTVDNRQSDIWVMDVEW